MTIKEVFNNCTAAQRSKIIGGIMLKGAAYATAFAWASGDRQPKSWAKPMVDEIINTETGGKYTESELWPD